MKKVQIAALVQSILGFCKPYISGGGVCSDNGVERWTSISHVTCPDYACGEREQGKLSPFQHSKECSLSLLHEHGRSEALVKAIARRAYVLDGDGQGPYLSCPICYGGTMWMGNKPKHDKGCPGRLALTMSNPEWFSGLKKSKPWIATVDI